MHPFPCTIFPMILELFQRCLISSIIFSAAVPQCWIWILDSDGACILISSMFIYYVYVDVIFLLKYFVFSSLFFDDILFVLGVLYLMYSLILSGCCLFPIFS